MERCWTGAGGNIVAEGTIPVSTANSYADEDGEAGNEVGTS
jgi:hypothetical protein